MLTYGSYLSRDTGIVRASIWVAVLDTLIALLSGTVVFPIIFSSGLEPGGGPGLVFKSIPIAFSQMPGGYPLSILFFVLLVFAALTSAMSLLEVVTSSFIDLYGWNRRPVSIVMGLVTFLVGVPSALSGGDGLWGAGLKQVSGSTFFDWADNISANWMLPLGGMLISLFVGHFLDSATRQEEFRRGTPWGSLYLAWLGLVRFLVPLGVLAVFLQKIGVLQAIGIG
jgi:NSS family neurotransmitter:Na+ symporter